MGKIKNFFKGRVFDPTALLATIFSIVLLMVVIACACGFAWICSNHPEVIALGLFGGLFVVGIVWLFINSFPKKEDYDESVENALDWLHGIGKLKDENEECKDKVSQLKEILQGVHVLAKGMLKDNPSCAEPLKEELAKIMDMTEDF